MPPLSSRPLRFFALGLVLWMPIAGCDFINSTIDDAVESYLVSLQWDTEADLDLMVTSSTGESLLPERDVLRGPGTETVSFEGAPSGTYSVRVRHYSGPPTPYTVRVQAPGGTESYAGTASDGATSSVATVNVGSGSGPGTGGQPPSNAPVVLLSESGLDGSQGSSRYFRVVVPTGARSLEVVMSEDEYGRNLGDLFVSHGQRPSVRTQYPYAYTADCASIEANRAEERCVFSNPTPGEWHILVYGYHAYYGTRLTAKYYR